MKPLWRLLLPLRLYMRQDVLTVGRSQVYAALAAVLAHMPNEEFEATLPNGRRARLCRHEILGMHYLVFGNYENAEVAALARRAIAGTVAIDVGANVGMMTIPLSDAVGQAGTVWAVEPVPENVRRLRENVALNNISNVRVLAKAIGAREGRVTLNLANDPAYHSLGDVYEKRATGEKLEVPLISIDSLWHASGDPPVSVIKIDTEGTEADVLVGASRLIERWRPALFIELPHEAIVRVLPLLQRYDYRLVRIRGLRSATKLFVADAAASR